jgi:carboxymethylenebutenolidase
LRYDRGILSQGRERAMTHPRIDQAVIDLYDAYTHTPLPRRVFLDRLAALAGSTAAASALLPLLENNYARAAMVAEADARITVERVTYAAPNGPMRAYLAAPAGTGRVPAVMVIHENRGLNAHIEDVARRAAVAGFLAVAPDALSSLGGTPADPDAARELIGKLDRPATIANLVAGVAYAAQHPRSTGKVGVVGFCWGGGMSNQMAVHAQEEGLVAAVPFYGSQASAEDAAKIKIPLQLHYAGIDERINAGIPAYEAALKAAGVKYELHMYEGAQHAFHNDTAEARYDAAAARLAWDRTIAFFKAHLG